MPPWCRMSTLDDGSLKPPPKKQKAQHRGGHRAGAVRPTNNSKLLTFAKSEVAVPFFSFRASKSNKGEGEESGPGRSTPNYHANHDSDSL